MTLLVGVVAFALGFLSSKLYYARRYKAKIIDMDGASKEPSRRKATVVDTVDPLDIDLGD